MVGGTERLLYEAPFMGMVNDFSTWRIDDFMRQMEQTRQKGRILPFVRGLRLSAQLIYVVRQALVGKELTANWGHLLDEKGAFCSPECDIIVHHSKGERQKWNGSENHIMDFRFISQEDAVAVISCKSFIRAGDIDFDYCEQMRSFVKRIWLFAECCGPRSTERIVEKAVSAGYEKFWHLYTWSRTTDLNPNKQGWIEFIKEVRELDSI